jgi:multiple sugar transport system ATP-binding protein
VARVSLKDVKKIYDNSFVAVRDINLNVNDREFIVIVGPSGCGKTTILRMIAGLEEITEGTVVISDRVVNDIPPKDRNIAMVFQNYALYPHFQVFQNMAFSLKLR